VKKIGAIAVNMKFAVIVIRRHISADEFEKKIQSQ
jgi:hypothetical protein